MSWTSFYLAKSWPHCLTGHTLPMQSTATLPQIANCFLPYRPAYLWQDIPVATWHRYATSINVVIHLSWYTGNNKLFLTLGKDRFMAVKASYIASGLSLRVHKNSRTLPHNATTFADIQYVLRFLHNYAEANAVLLPGRIPGYKRDDLQLLPSSTTKKVICTLDIHT